MGLQLVSCLVEPTPTSVLASPTPRDHFRPERMEEQEPHLLEAVRFLEHSDAGKLRGRHLTALRKSHIAIPVHRDGALRQHHAWVDEAAEGRDLAQSSVPLPSDPDHLGKRPPSLEREEAFRHAQTAKRQSSWLSDCGGDDAEFYHLGLLYDDEHERGPGFTFDTILHDQPDYAYSVVFRSQAKGGRKYRASNSRKPLRQEPPELSLNFSFTALSDDPDIARFLISPRDESADAPDNAEARPSSVSVPMPKGPTRIIYELNISAPASPSPSFFDFAAPRLDFSSRAWSPSTNTELPELVCDSPDHESDDGWALLQEPSDLSSPEEVGYGNASDLASPGHGRAAADLDLWMWLD